MTLQEFAKENGKSISTIIRWVRAYNERNDTDFTAGPKSEIPDNAPKFKSYLEFKAGIERVKDLKESAGDYTYEGGKDYPPEKLAFDDLERDLDNVGKDMANQESNEVTYNPAFFNKDGSPKKKRKKSNAKKSATEAKLIELDFITKAFSDNRVLIFLFLIPAIECTAAFSLIAFERFDNFYAAIAFGVIGTLVGYGMGSATVITSDKKERIIIEVVFGFCQVALVASLFLDLHIIKESALALSSMVTYFINRYVVGNRIHR